MGEKSWNALQELVSFETPSNLENWFSDGKPCPALKRAAQLRLFALGLASSKPTDMEHDSSLLESLLTFSNVLHLLRPADGSLQAALNFKTLNMLFDQDALVKKLALSDIPAGYEAKLIAKPFIMNMTKIELWLLGYDIAPDGYKPGEAKESVGGNLDLSKSKLRDMLTAFWTDLGKTPFQAELTAIKLVKSSFRYFFTSLQQQLENEHDSAEPDSEQVFNQLERTAIEENDHGLIQKVWDHVHSIGSRIWDGIKRAWRWVKAMMKKAVTAVAGLLKNLSRLAYHYILKSYQALKAVIQGVAGSISFFTSKTLEIPKSKLKLSGPNRMHIGRDRDFDFTVLIDHADQPSDVLIITDYINSKSKLFGISCRFLADLLGILVGLLKKAWFTGWAALLMALLKLYNSISHWAPQFIEAQQRNEKLTAATSAS